MRATEDILNADEGDHPAANVHKGAERFQMGYGGGDDLPGPPLGQHVIQSQLLGSAAGEAGDQPPFLLLQSLHGEADRLADPGENGDVPDLALSDAQSGLLPGNPAGIGPQGHRQIMAGVTGEGDALQNGP